MHFYTYNDTTREDSSTEVFTDGDSALEWTAPIVTTDDGLPVVDLNVPTEPISYSNDSNYWKSNGVTLSNMDFSDAVEIPIASLREGAQTEDDPMYLADIDAQDLPENQPPVAEPQLFVMNPESMKDGQYTTETLFFLATRWNSTDLCYDPEGGPISLIYNDSSFPSAYIRYYEDNYGTMAGYAILIFNEGTYPFAFAFMDQYGGASEPVGLNFPIIRRGYFETIEGELLGQNQTLEYEIPVDYSEAATYCLSLLRTGTGGYTVTIYDENGEECGSSYCQGTGATGNYKDIAKSIQLEKPSGITGQYTYIAKVKANSSGYVSGDTNFKLVYGAESQKQYFFEDVANVMDLPYYNMPRHYQDDAAEYVRRVAPSDYGDYYKITTTGPEVVTMSSTYGQHRFKILDPNTFETLFDSSSLETIQFVDGGSYYTRAKINFEKGATYYVVPYIPAGESIRGAYSISVGERRVSISSEEVTLSPAQFVKGQEYIWSFELSIPTQNKAYADSVVFRATQVGWLWEGNYFWVKTPGGSQWNQSGRLNSTMNFNFKNSNVALVRADGQWQFKLVAGQTGRYPGTTIRVTYYFEI